MRILQVLHAPQRRGAEVFARQLGEELGRRDHEVSYAALYPARGPAEARLEAGGEILELGGREEHPTERVPGFHPGLARRLSRTITTFRPDIVQLNGGRTVKYGALVAPRRGRRSWALVYRNIGDPSYWLPGPVRRSLFHRLLVRRIDGVACVSRATAELLRAGRLGAIPVEHIPRGVDPEALQPERDAATVRAELRTPPEAPVAVYLGNLSPEKRLDRLLGAVARRLEARKGITLWIVGGGRGGADLERAIEELGISGHVRLAGATADPASYLAAADLLVLTSDTEGVPGVVLEAGWLGVPALATDVGGVAEVVIDGVTGVLVPPGDEPALDHALDRLLTDAALRRRLGAAARARVERDHTVAKAADRFLAFYGSLLR